ncbi:fimbria/pilus outer membrane usher protein [Proteus terrae]|uniref:Fimbria/pilus outer membrane usher protein n=4 Tax=Proteus terrae TaxID=1574161 RepID=A0ABX6JI65_9GAMM|nr:fimbria/pilus outer membrane usher protein [Proteus terrae]MBG3090686.1 fimbrial biogenesis outer membrane usher protein [Proteus terrae subsp. cibarius]QGW04207.1 fimbrial biogenesis outer membrane usher protein [Proteus terrae subsp. cibarius]QIF88785.1 fimbria/pilus outer membrane usher protein [Proteus terrae subsp. cibarius]QKD68498.1 fimbrial biogenesis outer membrane usher protein [Proteus terrae subsp. cibarius]QKD73673.1 fimbrial biogenesis outer membrane usher protein [Proteus ter
MKIRKICISLILYLGYTALSYAENDKSDNIYFDPDFLELPNKSSIDLSQFENNEQLPGKYYVDIYVNTNLIGTKNIKFEKIDNGKLMPCLSISDLTKFGVKTNEYKELETKGNNCINLSAIPNAKSEFQFNSQRLYLSIPQIAMNNDPRGFVDLNNIDNGITALLLNYSYSGSKNYDRKSDGSNTTSNYINLRPGVNIGPWRLRNYTTWSNSDDKSSKWDTVYTYLSRSINQLKSQLILGDGVSLSSVFDSVPFRGIQLGTDDDMYPESVRGYAPVVRGIARSNAQITIKQNGYIIYQTEVAAGPFEINDLYPTGSSGDLYVTIKESNGSEQHQIVPFASLPVLQREGYLSYSVTGGEYRSYDKNVDKTKFGQFTLIYGLPYGVTTYGGSQLSQDYQSYSLGAGKNLGVFGAISVDITHANSTFNDGTKQQGQSYRFRYNKNLNNIGTNIALAGYRYSTNGFYSLSEVFDSFRRTNYSPEVERRRNRAEITINQNLGEGNGSLAIGYIKEDYWNSNKKTQSATLGYNNSWQGISYGMNYTYNKNTNRYSYISGEKTQSENEHLFAFSVSVPFSVFDDTFYYNFNTNSSNHNTSTGSVGISASQLNNRLNWSAQQGFTNQDQGSSGNINASYKGQLGDITGGYSYSKDNHNLYYGVNGSVVAHSGGIVLGQQLGETSAIVDIPNAKDIAILNQAGVKTNSRGYALVPYVTPYRKNTLEVDTLMLPENTEMELTSQTISPSRGALVKADFSANVGHRVLMTVNLANKKPVPFGAQVIFKDNSQLNSIVGNDGEVYLSGLEQRGNLTIKYNNETCHVNYDLSGVLDYLGLYKISVTCQ